MAAVQGLYVEIDFKFKNEAFMKGINDVKKLLKTLNTDFSNISKTAQGTMKNAGQAVKKGVETNLKQAKKAADDVQKSISKIGGTRIDGPLNQFNQQAQKSVNSANKLKQTMRDIGRGAKYAIGAYLAMQGRQAFQDFVNIDFEIRGAAAKTGGFEGDRKKLLKLAQDVGAVTKFKNLDVAQAINAGATLGLKELDLESVIPSSAKLAQGFNANLESTIESSVAYMKTYKKTAADIPKINDMVAVTARDSAADLTRLSEGFKYVGMTAQQMNIPMESVFAVLGKLNDLGLTGSNAGTAFNNFLVQLSKNYEDVEKLIGQKVTGKDGKLKNIEDIFDVVGDKFKTLKTDTEKTKLSMDLFGIRGSRAFFAFLETGTKDLRKFQADISGANGAVNQLATFMMAGSGGAIEIFLSTLESAFQSTFSSLEPLIVPVAGALTLVANAVIKVNDKMPYLGQMLAIVASFIVGKSIFALMAEQIGTVAKALSGPIILKMIAFAAVFMIIYEAMKRFKKALENDKEAAARWKLLLQDLKKLFKEIAEVIIEVTMALFGFKKEEENVMSDGTKKKGSSDLSKFLADLRDAVKKTQEKLEEFRDRIEKHKDTFKKWGETIKDWGPIMAGLAVTAWLLANPLMMITLGVTMLPVATEELKKAAKDMKKYAEEAEKTTEDSMFKKDGGDVRKQAFVNQEKKSRDRIKEIPILGSIYGFFEPILDFINSIPEAVINVFNDVGATIVDYGFEIGKALNYAMFGGLASDLGTKVGEKIRSINWGGLWDSVVNIAKSKWDSFVQWVFGKISELKERFPLLAQGLNAFHGALEIAKGLLRDIMNFSGKVITITLNFIKKGTIKGITNYVIEAGKKNIENAGNLLRGVQQEYTGTNYFSGGLTTINEKGDELIMGPSGMIVANNPSTMNIMSKLSNLESQTSQMRFRMNEGNDSGGGNNITVNIASVSNKSDVDYLISQLENLSLS